MKINYVLVDYENVQPKNLQLLHGQAFKVIVFVGANQSTVAFELVAALQALGDDAQYIKISGNGKNALDFHIAYYLGELVAKDPDHFFHIISKDAGYDPLIKHLRSQKILAQRSKDIAEIPVLKVSAAKTKEEKIDIIVKKLMGRGGANPKKEDKLLNFINSIFQKTLSEAELKSLIASMEKSGFISIQEKNVSYQLSKQ